MKKYILLFLLVLTIMVNGAVAAASSEEWMCPECGTIGTGNFCTNCGAEKPMWECPECVETVTGNYCGNCGAGKPWYLSSVEVGDIVMFGSYEQDNSQTDGNEPIEWLVLEKEDGKALIISRYALDVMRYHELPEDVTWETCNLRNWLNNVFYQEAFSAGEQCLIKESVVTSEDNNVFFTNSGNDTQDKIFLLSTSEAEDLFLSDKERKCEATEYAEAQGAYINDKTGKVLWWLRSPGRDNSDAMRVSHDGSISYGGYSVDSEYICVRPVCWVTIAEAEALLTAQKEAEALIESERKAQEAAEEAAWEEIKKAKVGDYVTFGSYEQDNNASNGGEPVEWLVLDKQDGRALVIGKYGLDTKPYNDQWVEITWETCTLRKWLNSTFYENVFSTKEKNKILETIVEAEENDNSGTETGNGIKDTIFVLSVSEAERLFKDENSRRCYPTEYAKANGAYVNDQGSSWWWLLSPAGDRHNTVVIHSDGQISNQGCSVDDVNVVVRPAFWINLD